MVEAERLDVFAGVHVCVSNLEPEYRTAVKKLVEENGGSYSGSLNLKTTTHLITNSETGQHSASPPSHPTQQASYEHAGQKVEAARKMPKMAVVGPDWVEACVAAGAQVDERRFPPIPPTADKSILSASSLNVRASTPNHHPSGQNFYTAAVLSAP